MGRQDREKEKNGLRKVIAGRSSMFRVCVCVGQVVPFKKKKKKKKGDALVLTVHIERAHIRYQVDREETPCGQSCLPL